MRLITGSYQLGLAEAGGGYTRRLLDLLDREERPGAPLGPALRGFLDE
jgi:hypothetical protein